MRNITMRNTFRHITAIIAIALLGSTAMTSWAQKTYTDEEKAAIKTKKQVIDNGDGSYKLKLETFVTGDSSNVFQRRTTTGKPMDIVLVLDVSGSMDEYTSRVITPAKYDTTARSSAKYTYNSYNNNYYFRHTDGKFYAVSKSTRDVVTYKELSRDSYSYTDLRNKEYYYKHAENEYYLVVREIVNDRYNLHYTANGTTYYLSGSTTTTTRPNNIRSNFTDIWTGVLYEQEKSTQYVLSYEVSGTTYYLNGSTASTTPSGATRNNNTIYDGVLYEAKYTAAVTQQTTTKKIDALKTAVNNFIDSVSVKSDAADPHKIAIVKFASDMRNTDGNETNGYGYNYTQIVKQLTDATDASLKTTITNLKAAGATSADYGMQHANKIFKNVDTTARKALVIMFTDGEPNHQSGFDTNVANKTIASSDTLKRKGVTVYTVGTFKTISDNITKYMNYTSSNHKNATSMTNSGTKVSSKYYMLADDADQINEAFKTITSEISAGNNGGEGITLDVEGENAVHLADIVTPSFKVPQGNNSVTLKMQFLDTLKLENPADTSLYVWRDEVDVPEEVKVSVIENAADTTSTIDITGFDFSANWVGPIYKKTIVGQDTTTNYAESTVKHGAKLVIYVDIIPNPDAEGGLVPTNTDNSGVYVGGVLITNGKLQDYITPEPVFTPMDLKIEIEGLGENENAIFNVKGGNLGDNGMNIILTSTTDGSVASATIAKVPLNDAEGRPYTYTVTLDDKWIWAYTPVEATDAPVSDKNYKTADIPYTIKEHTLYNAEVDAEGKITNYTTNHIFKFKVTPVPGVSGHGENFKNNEFKIMPKAAATE